ncbi:MAG: SCP2 sterol-binding domain-containing protein [Candidatus Lokiarchaeota archaeon]|nr:SCP2 sterol-binding domain-containing protein [Candidatus Harpocratesius repetitus]
MADKEKLMEKIEDGEFSIDDLPEFLAVFKEICNESEDVAEEVEDWDRKFQITLSDADNFWFKIEDGKFDYGMGEIEEPDVTLEMNGETAAGVFTGEIDATSAYMSGDLKIIGPLPDAVKFRTLTELVREEMED